MSIAAGSPAKGNVWYFGEISRDYEDGLLTDLDGSCAGNCPVTGEFTPLSPGGFEKKYYRPGIGLILAVHPDSGEREVLVKVSTFRRH